MSGFSWDWSYAWSVVPHLAEGFVITVQATVLGSIVALTLGLAWTMVRLAEIPLVSPIVALFVQFIRGTPFLVQLFFFFYVMPHYGLTLSPLATGVIALGLFYSAYASEVYRAGIEGIPVGQWEACLILGLPVGKVWTMVVLPQALRIVTPMLGNYVIVMFKETALLSTITVTELLHQAMDAALAQYRYIEPLTLVGAFYFVISYLSAQGVGYLERRSGTRV